MEDISLQTYQTIKYLVTGDTFVDWKKLLLISTLLNACFSMTFVDEILEDNTKMSVSSERES